MELATEGSKMGITSHSTETLPQTERVEPRGERLRRHGRHTGLYTWAFSLVALLVVLIALVVANTRQVKLSWVVDTGHASLVWIILASAVLGWFLGIVTSVVFRLRTGASEAQRIADSFAAGFPSGRLHACMWNGRRRRVDA